MTDSEVCSTTAEQSTVQLCFDEAFAMHHRLVYRYAYSLMRDQGLAEDVVQEVFIRLHRNLEIAQEEGMLRAWLLRVTTNIARNLLRTRIRATARDEEFVASAAQKAKILHPEEELLRQTEIAEARRTLNKIKEPTRSCLLLKHEGLSYREIAAALSIKESNVGSLIARGRREFIRLHGKIGK
ncbi:MAG: sigma-70 family RNA polymerase sigma factor [Acidobacteria bacterium]|nr:sigma-70 family RNA polymerase sigma factor [Acidobacteriota bacterium]